LNPAERHLVRIAAKKMRYSAEAFASLHGKQAAPFIAALAALQDELGTENDRYIAMRLLNELARKAASVGFQLGQLSGALAFAAAQHDQLPSARWKKLAGSTLFWR
jgi:CHAD domain-containing protein